MDANTPTGATRRTTITVLAVIATLILALLIIMTILVSDQFDDETSVTNNAPTADATAPAVTDRRPAAAVRRMPEIGTPAVAIAPVPRTPPLRWISPDDYPQSALRADEQGRSVALIDIAASGYPRACSIVVSSGSAALDRATCKVAMRSARFIPARNVAGDAVEARWTFPVRWVLPQ